MRIRYFMPLALLLSLMLIACQQGEGTSQSKLAVVDMTRIMRDSEAGKAGVKHLEALQADMQEQLNAIQGRLEKNANDADAQKELQTVYMMSQQRMQVEQQNVVNLLYDTIQRVINTYRTEKGYTVIISTEAAAAFDSKSDVTNEVLELVNKQKLDFKAVTPEAAKASEAAAPKAEAPKEDAKAPKADKK